MAKEDKVLTAEEILYQGNHLIFEQFSDAVLKGKTPDKKTQEDLCNFLSGIYFDIDKLNSEGASIDKIGRVLLSHFDIDKKPGRERKPSQDNFELKASLFYFLNKQKFGNATALEMTMTKYDRSERQIQRYNKKHGKVAESLAINNMLWNEPRKALLDLSGYISVGPIGSKPRHEYFELKLAEHTLFVKPLNDTRIRELKSFKEENHQDPAYYMALVDWWANNSIYLKLSDEEPSKNIKMSERSDKTALRFINCILSMYDINPINDKK